ncbi:beta-lactamase/transpeptidase-like protein [Massarina eburnea CBS 473.64]|uniref:Beta-lactamase/transpeptidase-like protein n=1 Tax=Massarina eburnea CBS 473.64 TaxID=1395130 RepID=A0A6A6SHU5_9PLEO|nr:beta-lactamase/transpeptidase-like protein [Massarina eburnea CBS 473.64]
MNDMKMAGRHTVIIALSVLLPLVTPACIPDVPRDLLWDPVVLQHPAVTSAFQAVDLALGSLFVHTTRDGLSFAIVHASTPTPVFTFNNGTLKNNETFLPDDQNVITSDSILRINSVSKNIATFSALLVENLSKTKDLSLEMSLDTPVRHLLPQFNLPKADWEDGGKAITLKMLASHTSGLPREGYSTDFNMVLGLDKADAESIGADWASATPESVLESVRKYGLMFAPGQRAAYSNTGISILSSAIVNFYNRFSSSDLTWSQLAMHEILAPLNMTHSFFNSIPDQLLPYIGIPGGPNWADLLVGEGYNPAAGMWNPWKASANDLVKYLYHIWLKPSPSFMITVPQRRQSLAPVITLPDGKQLVGPGWEIDTFNIPTSNLTISVNKTYLTYGKSGDGGGWHSWIDVVPNLGYGLVVLSQHSGVKNYSRISPTTVKETVQEILIPAFAEALASRMGARFAGYYDNGRDGGLFADEVKSNNTNTTTYAKLEVEENILYLRDLVINGTSALEGLDRLSWTADDQSRWFSTEAGVALTPSESASETATFGEGAQVWRMMIPGLDVCDWFDFDGYKDQNGWSLSKVVLLEKNGGVELLYPPFDVILSRMGG